MSEDSSPHGSTTVAFWEPALTELRGENGAKERRTAVAETADLLANLVSSRVRTIAFIKSRRGAETIASITKRLLDEVDPSLPQRVAAYRSGYLPEERRALEKSLRSGELLGVSSTSALELGIDISGLDAVLVAGWPGTRASLFQQIGRAGRAGQDAIAAFVASDDPLDTYLVNHPEAIFDVSVEATVFDPSNPYVLGPHLCAAAAELPLGYAELDLFGATSEKLLDQLVAQGYLRRRPAGWFWTHPQSAAAMVNLRADGGGPVSIVDADTGSLLGTMDSPQTHYQAHTGAIYVHQGESYVVEDLNEDDHCVVVRRANPDYYTTARDVTQIEVLETQRTTQWGDVAVHFGDVKVTTQVVSFQRKALISNEILGEEPLQLGARDLFTKAVWFVMDNRSLTGAGLIEAQFPGALHAAEHAAIGLLPLVASSDRWDIGGVSTAIHADTGVPTIFVYDGHPGGAGFAERGYDKATGLARRHPRRDQGLRVRVRLPVLCAVAQVRQQEQSPRQGRRRHPHRRAAQGRDRPDAAPGCRTTAADTAAGVAGGMARPPGLAERHRLTAAARPWPDRWPPPTGVRTSSSVRTWTVLPAPFRAAQDPGAIPACDVRGDGAGLSGSDSPGSIRGGEGRQICGGRRPGRHRSRLGQQHDQDRCERRPAAPAPAPGRFRRRAPGIPGLRGGTPGIPGLRGTPGFRGSGTAGACPERVMRGCRWLMRRGPAADGAQSGEPGPRLKGRTFRPGPRRGPRESREEANRRHREPCPRPSR